MKPEDVLIHLSRAIAITIRQSDLCLAYAACAAQGQNGSLLSLCSGEGGGDSGEDSFAINKKIIEVVRGMVLMDGVVA